MIRLRPHAWLTRRPARPLRLGDSASTSQFGGGFGDALAAEVGLGLVAQEDPQRARRLEAAVGALMAERFLRAAGGCVGVGRD